MSGVSLSTYEIVQVQVLAHKLQDRKRLLAKDYQEIRETVGLAAEKWEAITCSGILLKGEPGVHPPDAISIPFSVAVLIKAFPELEMS